MHITEIDIKNFKIFENFTFKPKMLNVITGRNNTGKTTLQEALYITFNLHDVLSKYMDFPGYLLRERSSEGSIKLTFSEHRKKSLTIKKATDMDVHTKLINILKKIITNFLEETNSLERSNKIKLTKLNYKDITELSLLFANNIENYKSLRQFLYNNSIKIMETSKKSGPYTTYLPIIKNRSVNMEWNKFLSEFHSLVNDWLKKHKKLNNATVLKSTLMVLPLAILNSIWLDSNLNPDSTMFESINEEEDKKTTKKKFSYIDDHILINILRNQSFNEIAVMNTENFIKNRNIMESIQRFTFNKIVQKKDTETVEVPFELMGDGFKKIAEIVYYIYAQDGVKIISIEEPENHLHPGYINEIVKLFIELAKDGIQIFVTTHSHDFIDTLLNGSYNEKDTAFLKKELQFVRLDKADDTIIPLFLDYEGALNNITDLELDLRGI